MQRGVRDHENTAELAWIGRAQLSRRRRGGFAAKHALAVGSCGNTFGGRISW